MKLPAVIRRYRVLLLLGILLWLTGLIFHPFEPRYQGRRLSVWAADLPWNADEYYFTKHDKAVAAIRHFGTRALPLALKLCRVGDTTIREKSANWSDQWNAKHDFIKFHVASVGEVHQRGIEIFQVLGSTGKPAIPTLIGLLQEKDATIMDAASSALCYIGPEAIPPLITALTNQNVRIREYAAITLGFFEAQARSAKPILLQSLKDENRRVREYAACTLGSIGEDPHIVVPAIMAALEKETNPPPLGMIIALTHFGTNAKPAVPLLIKILESQQPMSPLGALGALRRIDPESAKPYVEKWKASISNAQMRWLTNQFTNAPVTSPVEK